MNGVFSRFDDDVSRNLYNKQQAALATLPDSLRPLPIHMVPLRAYNVTGIENVRALLTGEFDFTI